MFDFHFGFTVLSCLIVLQHKDDIDNSHKVTHVHIAFAHIGKWCLRLWWPGSACRGILSWLLGRRVLTAKDLLQGLKGTGLRTPFLEHLPRLFCSASVHWWLLVLFHVQDVQTNSQGETLACLGRLWFSCLLLSLRAWIAAELHKYEMRHQHSLLNFMLSDASWFVFFGMISALKCIRSAEVIQRLKAALGPGSSQVCSV